MANLTAHPRAEDTFRWLAEALLQEADPHPADLREAREAGHPPSFVARLAAMLPTLGLRIGTR
jgi:hypothetical protein